MHAPLAAADISYLAGAALVAAVAVAVATDRRPKPNFWRINRQVDALLQHAGIKFTSDLPPDIQIMAADPGQKIQAIKLLRERTGLSIVDAKAAVEGGAGLPSVSLLERKLDALLQRNGIQLPSGLSPEVQRLARDPSRKIAAIKLHREQTGVSLSDAKNAIEEFGGR
jgi:ribosomal protein L7/L12